MAVETAIAVRGLRKEFWRPLADAGGRGLGRLFRRRPAELVAAVDGVSFTIRRGEAVAFIGPNGAGKSTSLKMLCGILHPTGGDARVAGHVPWAETRALAQRLGIVFGQRSQLSAPLPVRDSFDLLASIYDIAPAAYRERRGRLAEQFGIADLLAQPARSLSLGQRMRCDIVASLLHQPEILFLDEPTIGLDVSAKALLRDHLTALATGSGTTIVLTSHDTGDIERLCGRAILIDRGRIVSDGPLSDLWHDDLKRKILRLVTGELRPELDLPGVSVVARPPHGLTLSVDLERVALDQVIAACLARFAIQDLAIEDQPLDEVIRAIYARGGAR